MEYSDARLSQSTMFLAHVVPVWDGTLRKQQKCTYCFYSTYRQLQSIQRLKTIPAQVVLFYHLFQEGGVGEMCISQKWYLSASADCMIVRELPDLLRWPILFCTIACVYLWSTFRIHCLVYGMLAYLNVKFFRADIWMVVAINRVVVFVHCVVFLLFFFRVLRLWRSAMNAIKGRSLDYISIQFPTWHCTTVLWETSLWFFNNAHTTEEFTST
jgi:hypothetical protein